jgi:hypothetical protein
VVARLRDALTADMLMLIRIVPYLRVGIVVGSIPWSPSVVDTRDRAHPL